MRASLGFLALLVLACALAPVYARHVSGTDPFRPNVLGSIEVSGRRADVLAEGPGGLGTEPIGAGWRGAYLLGADALGRDVAARLLYGGRTSLLIAAAAAALCLALGVSAGALAGALGGATDAALSGLLDLIWAFPVMLLTISLAIVLAGAPIRLGPFVIASGGVALPALILGVVYTPYVARPVRAALVDLRAAPFVEAARATGGGRLHVLRRHLLPQLWPLLLGLAPVVAAMTLLTEATLSVLGLGVQAPGASWGTLIADGRSLMNQRPLVAIAPGAAVAATVLALNALAEAARGDG